MFEIQSTERWQVYRRLQELDIDCECACYEPLKVEIKGAIAAAQIWSVTRQFTASHQELVDWMENCWKCRRKRKR
jgi:TfoX/Sxy family transcriptional regulator of competence genes